MLRLPIDVHDAMIAHAREGTPAEVCGVIAGERAARTADSSREPTEGVRVDVARRTRRVPNGAETPRTRYSMPPEELLGAIRSTEESGDEVVGFYHSHPAGPSRPSGTDRDRATWDGYLYVIVALDERGDAPGGTVTAWRWDASEDRFHEESVAIGDSTPP